MKRPPALRVLAFLTAATFAQAQYFQPFRPIQPVQPFTTFAPMQQKKTFTAPAPAIAPVISNWTKSATRTPPFGGGIKAPKNNLGSINSNQYDPNSISHPYGAGNPYKADGLKNPYSQYGNPLSNKSASNPSATEPPKLVDEKGQYLGELSANPYLKDSVSNPNGKYGNPMSPSSVKNPFGAGNPLSTKKIYVVPNNFPTPPVK